ncbi:MAG: hypothetical protein CSA62_12625 [Planctomycetota bacterium]|nr:MAG: hypothetical protein CSA62_12625 [Planctomycetota bacterium]
MRLAAGVLIGAGLLLYGQVMFAEEVRSEVENTFFLWVQIGHATFFLQGADVQASLVLANIDPEYYEHSEKVALTLMILGACLLFSASFVRERSKKRT